MTVDFAEAWRAKYRQWAIDDGPVPSMPNPAEGVTPVPADAPQPLAPTANLSSQQLQALLAPQAVTAGPTLAQQTQGPTPGLPRQFPEIDETGGIPGARKPGGGITLPAAVDKASDVTVPRSTVAPATRITDPPAAPEDPRNVGQKLLHGIVDTYLALGQNLTEADLDDAEPLPAELQKFQLQPGFGTYENVIEVQPVLRQAAQQMGEDVIVRRRENSGEYEFALRPKDPRYNVLAGEGSFALIVNRIAQIADGFGRLLNLGQLDPVAGAAVTGGKIVKAVRGAKEAGEVLQD